MSLIVLNRNGIGADLKRAREQLRLSLSDAAALSGVSASHIWHLENAKKSISLELFLQVCMALALPYSDLIADNVEVDRPRIFESAVRALGADKFDDSPATEETFKIVVSADYAAGCAIVLVSALVSGDFETSGWNFPIPGLGDAFSIVMLRLSEEGINYRWDCLRELENNPVQVLSKLGLWTGALLTAYLVHVASNEKPAPWIPKKPKHQDGLYSSISIGRLFAGVNPESLGRVLRETEGATAYARARLYSSYLKTNKQKKKKG